MKWLFLLVFVAFFYQYPAFAQTQGYCGSEVLIKKKLTLYKEAPVFIGVSKSGHLVEIWLNPITSKFSALVVYSNKRCCLVDHGSFGSINEYKKPVRGKSL